MCYNCERVAQEQLRYGRRRPAPRPSPLLPQAPVAGDSSQTSPRARVASDSSYSTEHTLRLHRQGMSPEAIAEARGLTAKTIYAHLARLVSEGRVPSAEVLCPTLAEEIERAYGELAFPKTPEQVAALLPRPVPCELVAYALKARGLKLGGGRRLVSAEIAQAARVLQMAMSQSALQPYPLVRLLQGRKLPTDREKQLFGLFWGHDGDQLLEIVAELSERRRRRLEVAS